MPDLAARDRLLWVWAVRLVGMVMPVVPRPSAEVNEEIRALVEAGPIDSVRYRELVVEWAEAVRAEQQLAA